MIDINPQVSPRESLEHEWRIDEWGKQAAHAKEMKLLELELLREQNQAEIKLRELEAKWASWLRIPILIIKLPMFLLLGVAYCISMVTKKEMPRPFWKLLE